MIQISKLPTIKMPFKLSVVLPIFLFLVVISVVLIYVFKLYTPSGIQNPLVERTVDSQNSTSQKSINDTQNNVEEVVKANEPILKPQADVINPKQLFNVLILGIDRRYQTEESYRTDVIMLATVDPSKNKVILTSIPRDLWAEGVKINGVYVIRGYEAMKAKIKEITGMEPDRFIRVDFDSLVWVVDAMGGVQVPVERTFTDENYPNDRNGDPNQAITATFNQGNMVLNGENALIFSRSRKGNNGEGSDFARMRRQQVMLKAMPESFLKADPKNIFNPFILQNFYNLITQHMKTDMNVKDVGVIYDMLKDRNKYVVEHFVLDYDYLVNPPIEDYGQWVVVAKNNDYSPIHAKIQSLINNP